MIHRVMLTGLLLLPVASSQDFSRSFTLPGNGVSPKIFWKDQKRLAQVPSLAIPTDRCSIRLLEMAPPKEKGSMMVVQPQEQTAPMPNLQVPAPSCPKVDAPSDLVGGRP